MTDLAPTSRPSDDVTNGKVAQELPVAPALVIRRDLAQNQTSVTLIFMTLLDQAPMEFWIASTITQAIDLGPLHDLKHKINLSFVGGLPADKAMPRILNLFVPSEKIRRDIYWDAARDAALVLNVERARRVSRVGVCHSRAPVKRAAHIPRAQC